jgi:A/G-specific adenine glycosylase
MAPAEFRQLLLDWSEDHPRALPWKGERDPYRVWLSEVLLQQTRVEQGLPYYFRFLEACPDVFALAGLPEQAVFKLWEGLGYYSRARNLHTTAKRVAYEMGGRFPASVEGLRALPGIGAYTAHAIASFAFGLPYAVLDGNVYRVIARIWGYDKPINSPEAKRWFEQKAASLLHPVAPGVYNQAMMDFGATWCTPRRPRCTTCPMAFQCLAWLSGNTESLPVKLPKSAKKERYFLYAVISRGDSMYIRERTAKDVWRHLWEFPMMESPGKPVDLEEAAHRLAQFFFEDAVAPDIVPKVYRGPYRQVLTHQVIHGYFVHFDLSGSVWEPDNRWCWQLAEHVTLKKMYAVPRLIDLFLEDSPLTL